MSGGPTHVPPTPPWWDILEEGLVALSQDGRVLDCNEAAQKCFVSRVNVGDTPHIQSILSLANPSVLPSLLQEGHGSSPCTVLTARGPLRVSLSLFQSAQLRSGSRPPGELLLLLSPAGLKLHPEGASGIIAFYSLLMHELKNPLAALKMLVQSMQIELPTLASGIQVSSLLDTYLSRANREIDRVVKRMDSVKYLSKLTHERLDVYELAPVVRSVVQYLSPSFERQHVLCQCLVEEKGVQLDGDPDELRQVLLNLLDFALESMGERGGMLRIVGKREGMQVQLHLTDTGAGWTDAELAAFYARQDPFRSGSLGLSVARWIIERYQGSLTLVSQKGRGTTVEIRLPTASTLAKDQPFTPRPESTSGAESTVSQYPRK